MSSSQLKNSSKTSIAVVAGVGAVAAGAAALQDSGDRGDFAAIAGDPMSRAPDVVDSMVVAAADPAAAQGQQIEELVQAYLGEGEVGALNAEALSAADLQDVASEQESLQALADLPGVFVAQAGGGVGEFLTTVGGSVGGGAVAGGLLIGGGIVGAGLLIDEVSGSN